MPSPTYTLIQSTTLSSNASSIDFNNIPQSYYDLRLHFSLRVTGAVNGADLPMVFNGTSVTNNWRGVIMYNDSATNVRGYGVGVGSFNYPTAVWASGGNIPGGNQPSNIFNNGRLLIPGYTNTTSIYRGVGSDVCTPSTSGTSVSWTTISGLQTSNNAAVNRVYFALDAGYGLIAAGSTISLYGCTNS